ncbi:MAG: PAS domain-containing protein [Rhodoferax sp.]|nr:PAS domain-containing protein [Rhodoferax sp.]
MAPTSATASWLGMPRDATPTDPPEGPGEFVRLWRGFMTARVTLGVVLLALQIALLVLGQSPERVPVIACVVYLIATLATRLLSHPRRLGRNFDPGWLATIGVDVLAFGLLQYVQGHAGINYTPLLALPVLLASVLGSLPLAMGTAAGVSLLLLSQALLLSLQLPNDSTQLFAQAALTGAGCFLIAFLATQMSARLANEEQRSLRSQLAVHVQRQVNELVIESMADGVLVVDVGGMVWAANPSARALLGREADPMPAPFEIGGDPSWSALGRLAAASFSSGRAQRANLVFTRRDAGPLHVLVRTRLTAAVERNAESLCVIFMQDQREAEARMRTEKLASMGRMSTAVAHEIRNPLAAIVQANALLDEEVVEPHLRHLIQMVRQNALRLERIVDEVLDISRVPGARADGPQETLLLNDAAERVCLDWAQHSVGAVLPRLDWCQPNPRVFFDAEHLRRVLVNLLDNARRYASAHPDAIQVATSIGADAEVVLGVWSDGPPMEQSVERHLFEPFFSSESRSTGLGLYICRELCEGHGASIRFKRVSKNDPTRCDGNEFQITFEPADRRGSLKPASDRIPVTPWQQQPL